MPDHSDHPRLEQAIRLLEELVGFDTVSTRSNRALIDHVETFLDQQGVGSAVQVADSGDKAVLLATMGPENAGGVLLSGHTDVVDVAGQDWDTPPFELRRRDGRLYGRGTCDMKGFIACALAMVPVFAEAGLRRPLQLAFSRDEEIGCLGTGDLLQLIEASGVRPEVAIVGEPTRMKVVSGHKGGLVAHTVFRGVPAHSSLPDQGVSAIPPAARFVIWLGELEAKMAASAPPDSPFAPAHGTINVGTLAGGTALNIFASRCELGWHYRSMPDEDLDGFAATVNEFLQSQLLPQMRPGELDAGIDHRVDASYPGLAPLPAAQSPALQLVAELTGETGTEVLSIGTEAGHFQRAGISSVVLGPGDLEQAHKPNEYLAIDQMVRCLEFFDALAARMAAPA